MILALLYASQPRLAFGQADSAQRLNIVVIEGEGAVNNVRQRVAREPIVQVEDENHRPVAGAVVTFFLPGQGASGAFPGGLKSLTVQTDNTGRAVARGFKPNQAAGRYQIRVSAKSGNLTGQTTINASNVVGAAAGVAGTGLSVKLLTIILIGTAAVAGGVVAGTQSGGGGSKRPAATPPTVVSPGTPSVGAP